MRRLLFGHIDQIRDVIANGPLSIFVERGREPEGPTIRERAKTGVDMVKAWIDQLD